MLLWISRFFCALPLPVALKVARAVGWVWFWLVPVRRRVALHNVQRALGDSVPPRQRRRIVRKNFAHLCMYAVECLRMLRLDEATSNRLVDRTELWRVEKLLERGKGVIVVTAHMGNFDLLGASQSVRGWPVHAVFKDIAWKPGHDFWQAIRRTTRFGHIAPRNSGYRIIKLLRRNQIIAFAVDQHMPPHRAIVCDFFAQLAATTPAPVRLALATGAPIIPAFMLRTSAAGQHRIFVEPEFILETPYDNLEANVVHNTARINRLVERWVATWPEQWLWPHRRWKVQDRPEGWDIPAAFRHLVAP